MLGNNVVDYMINSCKGAYNLENAKLIKKNVEDKKVQFVFKRSDLKLNIEFANDKISGIIYNNFLTDSQRENVTESEYCTRLNEMLEITDIDDMNKLDEISRNIIKKINSEKLFGENPKELLLNREDREKLVKIKRFFGAEPQLLKLYEEIEELQTAYKNYRKTFIKEIYKWLNSKHTYTVRFAIGMLMIHYLGDDYKSEYLELVANIKSEEYYINMMIAWYMATALINHYDEVVDILNKNVMPVWVHNKTIQKVIESFRITKEQKDYLRTLKRSKKEITI